MVGRTNQPIPTTTHKDLEGALRTMNRLPRSVRVVLCSSLARLLSDPASRAELEHIITSSEPTRTMLRARLVYCHVARALRWQVGWLAQTWAAPAKDEKP